MHIFITFYELQIQIKTRIKKRTSYNSSICRTLTVSIIMMEIFVYLFQTDFDPKHKTHLV